MNRLDISKKVTPIAARFDRFHRMPHLAERSNKSFGFFPFSDFELEFIGKPLVMNTWREHRFWQ